MKNAVFGILSVILLTACDEAPETSQPTVSAPITEKQGVKTFSAEEFFATTTVFGSSINHDGTAVLVSSDATGVFNAYRYPVDGSKPEQLTTSVKDTIYGVSWFPNDNRFIYTADQGGNELNHLYVQELDGSVKDLTPGESLKAGFLGWSDNGDFFAISNERDPKAFDVYRYSSKDYQRELVFENEEMLSIGDVSRDGRWLSLTKAVSGADSDLYLIDLNASAKDPIHITPHEGNIEYFSYGFTPDSGKLIFATNEHSEFNQAWAYDLESGESELFYETNWDVGFVYFSKDGKYTVVGINEDAQNNIKILNSETKESVELPTLPAGDLRGINFSDDSNKMVFYINADNSPSNLYVYTFTDDKVVKLTETLNPAMTPEDLVSSTVVRFKSFDGLEIPGLLYKPLQASAQNKVPALVWVHGGPGGQSRKGYSAAIQHLVNHGYAIFAVNNRGSSGYGKTFYHLDDKNHGEGDLQDIVYGKKHLQTLDWVDGTRIGIIGGSYGGYMTMAGMAFTDEFEVGINIFGVTNWVRTLTSIPPWWEAFKQALYDEMGDPATDAERHRRISPLFHAKNIKKPVLVVQGANDPRVLQVESDEMVAAIEANNVPVEYVLFEDEGHGFRKKANRITASNAYVRFLDRHLKNSANQL
ncbi:S9 family peptidase [Thalassotalea mangrovi]|uniref:S9 family peptidase n=1 Tax=Thalassotalea mangrovi TaxID=2572245 RepID=A0A4U1B6A8_9GAMM|nr:S9 family peptidase [Thalassotalea mangrovi]TKB45672.1 S9 family peptidase [Thalassotalea mangrovi]